MKETWVQANARRACLNCGASGGRTFRLRDGRTVRACESCLRGPCADWLAGVEVEGPARAEDVG